MTPRMWDQTGRLSGAAGAGGASQPAVSRGQLRRPAPRRAPSPRSTRHRVRARPCGSGWRAALLHEDPEGGAVAWFALLVTRRRSHTTGMQSKVHPTYKTKYRVANWPAYNRALVRRGDVTVWVSSAAVLGSCHRNRPDPATPLPSPAAPGRRVPARPIRDDAPRPLRPQRYDALPAQSAFEAPFATGPDRRGDEGLHLVLDTTGLSIVGAGEWVAVKHGGCGRRGWRKLHRGVDQSGVIRVHTLTGATGEDATTALDLLDAVKGPLVRVTADAASDTVALYETSWARGATVVIPPARTANVSGHGPRSPARDRTITLVKTLERRQWKQASGYHRQDRVENTFFRDTSIIGDGLRVRSPAGQGSEAALGYAILNRMTALGRPVSSRIGR